MSHRKCCVYGLYEQKEPGQRVLFAKFSLDPNRCREWVKLVGNEELVHIPIEKLNQLRHVCGKHFDKKFFKYRQTRLKKFAVPSLNLRAIPPTDDQLKGFSFNIPKSVQSRQVSTIASQSKMDSKTAQTQNKHDEYVPLQTETSRGNQMQTAAVPTELVSETCCAATTEVSPAMRQRTVSSTLTPPTTDLTPS